MKTLKNLAKLAIIPVLAGSFNGCDMAKTKILETNPKNMEAIIEKEKDGAVAIKTDKISMRFYKERDPEIYNFSGKKVLLENFRYDYNDLNHNKEFDGCNELNAVVFSLNGKKYAFYTGRCIESLGDYQDYSKPIKFKEKIKNHKFQKLAKK
ncbi:hypothetical protein HYS72_00290 [Candidatus Pacearchaeota archaeon]|nr:hypothetical protein [Candidatus Pacearchaeota archaeon]MBI2056861.1 hypothetical protein [Candidatus Pacearchaeota archaeon]